MVITCFPSIHFVYVNAVRYCTIEFLSFHIVAVLLLLVLLNRKDVTEEPLKNLSITVNRNINLLIV